MGNVETKKVLRQKFSRLRDTLESREGKSLALVKCLLESPLYKNARGILVYVPIGSEVDIRPLMEQGFADGKELYAPHCPKGEEGMSFYRFRTLSELVPGNFKVPEPLPLKKNRLSRENVDESFFCLVPGLAFDKRGFRLGYGKGYYDRFLAGFKIRALGITYEALVASYVPAELHDQRVQFLLTEKGMRTCTL